MDDRAIALTADASSPTTARRFVRNALAGSNGQMDDVLLCVSELVSNAVVHARTVCEVRVSHPGSRIRVEVRDYEPRQTPVRRSGTRAMSTTPNGRGLVLVNTISDAWGVDVDTVGKTVWFELRLPLSA